MERAGAERHRQCAALVDSPYERERLSQEDIGFIATPARTDLGAVELNVMGAKNEMGSYNSHPLGRKYR